MPSLRPTLDRRAASAIAAAVERIVPTDDDPGAREAGTARYVIRRAATDEATHALYRSGAAVLDAEAALHRPGARFADLDGPEQDALLARLDARADPFFGRLVVDTLEGFYGDPRHGGNDGAVSWRMIGFPGPTGGRGYDPPLGWYDADVPDDAA